MQHLFTTHINQNLKFLSESNILIAISGGLDSIVLTHLCKAAGLKIALAHCNFNLRGAESDADEEFVLNLADHHDLEVFIQHFSTEVYANSQKLSIQMAARELRYNWFIDLAADLKFDYILTAHHADDNLETFLINLTRGTGLNGLTGIPKINGNIIRPLLPFTRTKLEHYAQEHHLEWREDSSNVSDKYLRNKIRHQVIPVLKEINTELLESFKKTLETLNDTADIVEESVNAVAKRAIETIDGNQIKYKISEFKRVNNPKAYLYELFKDFGFTEWNDVLNLLDAQSGKFVLSETHRLLKDREHLILTESNESQCSEESRVINVKDKTIIAPFGILLFDEADAVSQVDRKIIYVDKNKLNHPLKLRKWEPGDYFYPFGMTGKKKLSKYFKDEKLSLIDKEQAWLLCSDNQIVWVIGRRADDRFKVANETKAILRIELVEKE